MSLQSWRASVTYATAAVPITDEQADALVANLPGYGIAVHDGERIRLEMSVDASTLRKAGDEALRAGQSAYAAAFDVVGTPVALEVLTDADHQQRIAHPAGMDLMSATEVGKFLGVSRQRVHELAASPDFPAPVAVLKTGKIWAGKSIEAFAQRWPRLRGWAGKHAAEAARARA